MLAALALVATLSARAADPPAAQPADEPWTVLGEHPGEGEQCLVCGQPVYGEDVVEIRYKGRVFYVAAGMADDFRRDPDRYFRKLQARAALFDEEQVREAPLATGWLLVGLYVLAGLLCGALAAYLAVGRSRPPLTWFLAGLLGNVVALAALLLLPRGAPAELPAGIPPGLAKVPRTRSPAACPTCGAPNHPAAAHCSQCGSALSPLVAPETSLI